MKIGEWIRAQRKALGWTREELARAVGTTAVTVYRWERGENRPTGLYLVAVKAVLSEKPGPGAT